MESVLGGAPTGNEEPPSAAWAKGGSVRPMAGAGYAIRFRISLAICVVVSLPPRSAVRAPSVMVSSTAASIIAMTARTAPSRLFSTIAPWSTSGSLEAGVWTADPREAVGEDPAAEVGAQVALDVCGEAAAGGAPVARGGEEGLEAGPDDLMEEGLLRLPAAVARERRERRAGAALPGLDGRVRLLHARASLQPPGRASGSAPRVHRDATTASSACSPGRRGRTRSP